MRVDFDVLVLPVDRRSAFRSLVVLHERAPQLLLFNLRRDEIVEVLVLLRVPEEVLDGMGTVVLQIINVLPTESVNPIAVQVTGCHCERWEGNRRLFMLFRNRNVDVQLQLRLETPLSVVSGLESVMCRSQHRLASSSRDATTQPYSDMSWYE